MNDSLEIKYDMGYLMILNLTSVLIMGRILSTNRHIEEATDRSKIPLSEDVKSICY